MGERLQLSIEELAVFFSQFQNCGQVILLENSDVLHKCRYTGLVELSDKQDMNQDTFNLLQCRLTSLGKYFWRLLQNED